MCGSCFARIVQRSCAKRITFWPSSKNRSLPAGYEGNMATLLRLIVYALVRTSKQSIACWFDRPHCFFLYEMLYLI